MGNGVGDGPRVQGNILCNFAMHGHPLQKDSYRLLDFTVAVGIGTHWLRNLVRERENSFRADELLDTSHELLYHYTCAVAAVLAQQPCNLFASVTF